MKFLSCSASHLLKTELNEFYNEAHEYLNQIPNIRAICKLNAQLADIKFLQLVVENNLKNAKYLIPNNDNAIRDFWLKRLQVLEENSEKLYIKLAVNINMKRNTPSESRVREEMKTISLDVKPEELIALRKKIVPSSETSLTEQKNIVVKIANTKETELAGSVNSLDALKVTIQNLQSDVERLQAESKKAKEKLQQRRAKLREGLEELIKLEKLIEQIEREISERIQNYQTNIDKLEGKKMEIMNNINLTEEEKCQMLNSLDDEIHTSTVTHKSEIKSLTTRKDELIDLSRTQGETVGTILNDLKQFYTDEIAALEQRKIGSSPSEILKIEEEIQQKRHELAEGLMAVKESKAREQFFSDERGRYFIGADGKKIYKANSFASEKYLNEDGEWETIKVAEAIYSDENGTYVMDKYGQKVYTQRVFLDQNGCEYKIEDDGNRIYMNSKKHSSMNSTESIMASSVSSSTTATMNPDGK